MKNLKLTILFTAVFCSFILLCYYKSWSKLLIFVGSVFVALIIVTPLLLRSLNYQTSWFILCAKIVVVVSMAVIPTVAVLSWNSLWCCVHEDDINNLCVTANKLKRIMNKSNVSYFICYGSALSAYRNNGQHMKHEHDVDICLKKEEKVKFLSAITNTSTYFESYRNDNYFRFYSSNDFLRRIREKMAELWIDVYFDEFSHLSGCLMGANKVIRYCGSYFSIPHDVACYLETVYGSTYMIPKPKKGFSEFACTFWSSC